MTYARAGHTPLIYLPGPSAPAPSGAGADARRHGARPAHRRGGGEVRASCSRRRRIDLVAGDVIVLYTDGITEAMNADERSASATRGSAASSRSTATSTSGELRERILREIEAFVGGADQHDDMTMILMKVEHGRVAAVR